ncbi:MAG: hypothetical protein ABI443_11450 [Chthoniobacterales bacterium]
MKKICVIYIGGSNEYSAYQKMNFVKGMVQPRPLVDTMPDWNYWGPGPFGAHPAPNINGDW